MVSFQQISLDPRKWAVLSRPEDSDGPFLAVWELLWQAGSKQPFLTDQHAARLMKAAVAVRNQWLEHLCYTLQDMQEVPGSGEPGTHCQITEACSILSGKAKELLGRSRSSEDQRWASEHRLSSLLGLLGDHPLAKLLRVWRACLIREEPSSSWPSDQQNRDAITSAQQQLAQQHGRPATAVAAIRAAMDAVDRVSKIIPAAKGFLPDIMLEVHEDFQTALSNPSMHQDLMSLWEMGSLRKHLEQTKAASMIQEYEARISIGHHKSGMSTINPCLIAACIHWQGIG